MQMAKTCMKMTKSTFLDGNSGGDKPIFWVVRGPNPTPPPVPPLEETLPGQFVKADKFSRRRWRHIQHIANEFWVRWYKEFLWSLQTCPKWNNKCRNFQKGDTVNENHNQWPMAKVIGGNAYDTGFV